MAETATEQVQKTFLTEVQTLSAYIEQNPQRTRATLAKISVVRDTARILNDTAVHALCSALESVYKSVRDKKITYTAQVLQLLSLTAQKLAAFPHTPESVTPYVVWCDKAAAGEIFDPSALVAQSAKKNAPQEQKSIPQKSVPLSLTEVNRMLNHYEELLARTFKITSDLAALPHSAAVNQIMSDVQFVQAGMQHAHTQLLSAAKDDEFFVSNHRDFHGFFVFANQKKYFLSAEHIVDVTYENELEYVTEQGQRYLRQTTTDADGEESEEKIPVYALSSLFPGQKAVAKSGTDIIMIAEYMQQKVGMIVDAVQSFASLVKKNLPGSFRAFAMLEGIVFDEQYAMIPILSVPEILKRFRSQRGYEAKIFEANTTRRVPKVLVADDSETTRQVLKTILTANGFAVDQAVDGIDAIDRLKATQYDVVVTDDAMPRMNGEILVDNLRRMERYATVPVVCMAAKPIEKADAFISKADFKRSELIQKIQELVHE